MKGKKILAGVSKFIWIPIFVIAILIIISPFIISTKPSHIESETSPSDLNEDAGIRRSLKNDIVSPKGQKSPHVCQHRRPNSKHNCFTGKQQKRLLPPHKTIMGTSDLPEGKLRSEMESLSLDLQEKALATLIEQDLPLDDESLHIDSNGNFYYKCTIDLPENIDPRAIDIPLDSTGLPGVAANPISSDTPPALHSKPGASRVCFMDFNGGLVSGTIWGGPYDCRPYSLDGDESTFSVSEQQHIVDMWKRVAEDFAPFDIDVTTEQPAVMGNSVGWLMITSSTDKNGRANPHSRYGGIAYLNIFGGGSNGYRSPAWCQNYNSANGAEVVSHEFGHNLGLYHDGTSSAAYYGGHVNGGIKWGPIMGTGYYADVSQWSKGEYYRSNNSQDDLAKIAGKLTYRPDDHRDTNGTASTLNMSDSTTISDSGIIETTDDPDVFQFNTKAGPITLNANTYRADSYTWGGNLDILLELRDSSGSLVASDNPANDTNASISTTVLSGLYYLHVIPVGVGNPMLSTPTGYTSYASLGQYVITGSIQNNGISISGVSVAEGDAGTSNAVFNVTLNGASAFPVTVDYATTDNTAEDENGDGDYQSASGTLTFLANETQQVTVTVNSDAIDEDDETFYVNLSNVLGSTIGIGQGTGMITDDDTSDVSVNNAPYTYEGDSGTTNRAFTVSLAGQSSRTITVDYYTDDGSAEDENGDGDYQSKSGTLTFTPGETSKQITILVNGDQKSESNESFYMRLHNVVNSTISDNRGYTFILNDDAQLAMDVNGNGTVTPAVGVHALDTGSNPITATPDAGNRFSHWAFSGSGYISNTNSANTVAVLSGDSTVTANFIRVYNVTFDLGTRGTRIGGGALSQSVDSGSSAIAPTLSVDPGWSFSGWSQSLNNITSDLTITANYVQNTLSLSWVYSTISEQNGRVMATVTRNTGTSGALTVNLSSSDTTEATVPASVIIPDGQNSATFDITGVDDYLIDGTQNVTISASAILYIGATKSINITNNDIAGVSVTSTYFSFDENGGSGTFDVRISAQPDSNVVLNVTSSNVADVTATPATLTFTPGNWNQVQTITLTAIDDQVMGNGSSTITVSVDDANSDDNFDPLADKTVSAICLNDDTEHQLTVIQGTGSGTYVSSVVVAINAENVTGMLFKEWTGDVANIADVNDSTTTITMPSANAAITATYIVNLATATKMTIGSFVTVNAGDITGMGPQFTSAPKIYGTYIDPGKNRLYNGYTRGITRISAKNPNNTFESLWNRSVALYNVRALIAANKNGTSTADWLTANPIANLACSLHMKVRKMDRSYIDVFYKGALIVPPEITSVERWDGGDPSGGVHPNSILRIKGEYFGDKAPLASLEYMDSRGRIRQQRLRVQKPYVYANYQGSAGRSCMDQRTGISEVNVEMPKRWWKDWTPGTYSLVLKNRLGVDTVNVNTINIATNTAPTANNDNINITIGQKNYLLDVLANESENEADKLKISLNSKYSVLGGRISVVKNKIRYIPPGNVVAPANDSFDYNIDDGLEQNDTATVNITINN